MESPQPVIAAKTSSAVVSTAVASPSPNTADNAGLEFDASLSEDERRFYTKAYPSIDLVRERKVHCTVCKVHIGTAPSQESSIKMHPILRVTHCQKCHDFYNSGEFSKGEDGSELYCRWCGQGGEVYCCSNCPYVFCKSCIVKNLSRGVVADIEQNENWSCFSCAPKILWPLRAQHWALINYIDKQKKSIQSQNLGDSELRQQMARDLSTCCRLAKAKCGNMSDSMESLDSQASRRSFASVSSATKKPHKLSMGGSTSQSSAPKRLKTSNDDIVCTPDLMSMLEPDCQITMSPKPRSVQSPATSTPKVLSIQTAYGGAQANSTSRSAGPGNNAQPPPLVLRNTGIHMRPIAPAPVVRRTVVGPRAPNPGGNAAPVYHTINGYRIDLNSAAQQETFRLPNGKLIQVKRQGTQHQPGPNPNSSPSNNWQQRSAMQQQHQMGIRPVQITQSSQQSSPHHYNQSNITIHLPTAAGSHHPQQHPQMVRYHNTMVGNTTVTPLSHSNGGGGGAHIQVINGAPNSIAAAVAPPQQPQQQQPAVRPLMVRHVFPDTAIGQARTQLQDQVFNAMEICQHLTGKVQTLTNSNAYKQARNYLEVKELYIHLSYLLTYAIGRFKGLQDKCLGDMRQLGFGNDADSLENGQLAAGVDYVRYGQLEEADFFNTGCNSFHNQVYEYRKNLHENLEDGVEREPLSPLMELGLSGAGGGDDEDDDENDADENGDGDGDGDGDGVEEDNWGESETGAEINKDEVKEELDDGQEEPEESYMDDDGADDEGAGGTEDDSYLLTAYASTSNEAYRSTEDVMRREEQSHAYDRKLTRLIEQYPSIWCTRHPDYGNFDVTRKQWRTIAAHFKRTENIKLRWKNIRKRFVRIERRLREGKRFNGYFDKATNFLSNRDLPTERWLKVDRGEADGDAVYDRKQLDTVEQALHPSDFEEVDRGAEYESYSSRLRNSADYQNQPVKPIELRQSDLRIINFVKCNPVLWRKTSDPMCNKVDEHTRRALWMHLWKSMPNKQASDDEDNEIEIVEPKTDTITLDSDNDDDEQLPPKPLASGQIAKKTSVIQTTPATITTCSNSSLQPLTAITTPNSSSNVDDGVAEFLTTAQSILASMLEVDLVEGDQSGTAGGSPGGSSGGDSTQKKQPRKKTTHKPNPTLLRQKEMLERQRLEEMKQNDQKLKMKCSIELKKAEEEFPFAKEMLEEKDASTDEHESADVKDKKEKNDDDVELVEVMEVDDVDSSAEEEKESKNLGDDDIGAKEEKTKEKEIDDENIKESIPEEKDKIIADKDEEQIKSSSDVKETEEKKEVKDISTEEAEKATEKQQLKLNSEEPKKEKEEQSESDDKKENNKLKAKLVVLQKDSDNEKSTDKNNKEIDNVETETVEAKKQSSKENTKENKENNEDSTVPEKELISEKIKEISSTEEAVVEEVAEITDLETVASADKTKAVDEDTLIDESVEMIELTEEQIEESEDKMETDNGNDKTDKGAVLINKEEDQVEKEEEDDLDVDKEIAKLLQKKDCEGDVATAEEPTTSSSTTEADGINAKEIITIAVVETAEDQEAGAAAAASPDLFNDITELIEKENNAMT